MFGPIGGFELLVLVTLGLLVFGPRRLPEIGRSIGRTIAELRRAALEVRTTLEREVNLDEIRQDGRSLRTRIEETLLGEPRRIADEVIARASAPSPPPVSAELPAPSAPAPSTPPGPDAEPRG